MTLPNLAVVDQDTQLLPKSETFAFAPLPSGIYTIKSPFGHRTFEISRQPKSSDFAADKRVLYLFTGTNNESPSDWTGFAFVEDGAVKWPIHVWQRYRGPDGNPTDFQRFANMIREALMLGIRRWRGPDGEIHDYEVWLSRRCRRCDRRLTDPESVRRGTGPECAKNS